MTNLQPILLIIGAVAIAASAFAAHLWRQIQMREGELAKQSRLLLDKAEQLERSRKGNQESLEELEKTRATLQETKAKLRRQQKEQEGSSSPKKRRDDAQARESLPSHIVHVSNQELSEQYEKKLDGLRRELEAAKHDLDAARSELAKEKALKEQRRREAEQALSAQTEASARAEASSEESEPAETRLEKLKTDFAAFREKALARERSLESKRLQAERQAKSATKRATANHALYQVIRGQLELAEDRLGLLRKKYEGAKDPAEVERELRAAKRTEIPGEPREPREPGRGLGPDESQDEDGNGSESKRAGRSDEAPSADPVEEKVAVDQRSAPLLEPVKVT